MKWSEKNWKFFYCFEADNTSHSPLRHHSYPTSNEVSNHLFALIFSLLVCGVFKKGGKLEVLFIFLFFFSGEMLGDGYCLLLSCNSLHTSPASLFKEILPILSLNSNNFKSIKFFFVTTTWKRFLSPLLYGNMKILGIEKNLKLPGECWDELG